MLYRKATVGDIPQLEDIRNNVTENKLSDTSLINASDYRIYLSVWGKGWVCEDEGKIVGFAVADLKRNNIWALFLRPDYEGKGVGTMLHNMMLEWYFSQTEETVWLSTGAGTRAEKFYRAKGWIEVGPCGNGEIRFEMKLLQWKRVSVQKKEGD